GSDAQTTRDNQIILGTALNTVTLRGLASAASTAAQGTLHGIVTTDADGNLASDGGALQSQVSTNTSDITTNASEYG
ncbi:hypothetical protein N9W89_14660, partial [Hellea sp.]|nr:hypothetical protein [Hellea sp.]